MNSTLKTPQSNLLLDVCQNSIPINSTFSTPQSAYSITEHEKDIFNISKGNGGKIITYRKCISCCMELQFMQIFAELPGGLFALKQCFTILQFEGELLLDVKNLAEMQEVIKLICKYFRK